MHQQDDGLHIAFRLVNGDVRHAALGTRTGSVGNVLDRLQDWIETDDGTWIQKLHIVEATIGPRGLHAVAAADDTDATGV